jgi:hypothetical protein
LQIYFVHKKKIQINLRLNGTGVISKMDTTLQTRRKEEISDDQGRDELMGLFPG